MHIQEYFIHLVNGDHIRIGEDCNLPMDQSVVGKFLAADRENTLIVGDEIMGFFYVPKCNILFIASGEIVTR